MQTPGMKHGYHVEHATNCYRDYAFGNLSTPADARIMALRETGQLPAINLASKLASCCTKPIVRSCMQGEQCYISEQRCKSRVCIRCARIRASLLSQRIANLVREMDDPRFLTISMASRSGSLAEQIKHLRRRFGAFRRTEAWKYHVVGGVYTIEITINQETGLWHPHIHAIIDGRYWQHADLLQGWERVVKANAAVDIRIVRGVRKLANYIASYVSKSCDLDSLTPDQLAEWALETHGLRLAQTFGDRREIKVSQDKEHMGSHRDMHVDLNKIVFMTSWGCDLARSILHLLTSTPDPHPKDVERLYENFCLPRAKRNQVIKVKTPPEPMFPWTAR